MTASFNEFGLFLSQQRQLRALSRDEVARLTRIPVALVAALEEGQSDRLPERVFVVNHLKAYAQALGLSPEDVLNRFYEIPGTVPPTEVSPSTLETVRRKNAWLMLGLVVVLMALAGLVLWWWTEKAIDQNHPVPTRSRLHNGPDSSVWGLHG